MWNASIFILFSGVFAQMFFPDLSFGTQIAMAIGITWLVVIMTCLSLRIGKWIPNTGATLKTITFAILAVIPSGDINLVEGLVDTLRLLFGESQLGQLAAMTLGVFALLTFFSNGTTWAIGANRAAAESAADGELPRLFAVESPNNGSPVGATILMGIVCTGVLLAYSAVAGTNEDLFWSPFAASAVLFILPYIAVVAAFYRARRIDGERPRPFRVPGGNSAALGMSGLCMFLLAITALLFMYVPGSGFDWPVVIGSVTCILLGEVAMRYAEYEKHRH